MTTLRSPSSFLDLPPEIRNQIYTFATYPALEERTCVAPCIALVRTCKQVRQEYYSICMKAAVTIEWRDIPRYFEKYYASHDGTLANIELAPARMTIITNASLKENRPVVIDLLPILKFGLANENFKCDFIRAGNEENTGCVCVHNITEVTRDDLKTLLAADVMTLQKLIIHRDEGWIEDVNKGQIHKLMASHIGTSCCPKVTFYVGPGEQQIVPSEFVDIAKNKGNALLAEEGRTHQRTASHRNFAFSRAFDKYMDRIKLHNAFTDNRYSYLAEFKWSSDNAVRSEEKKITIAARGGANSESGVAMD